MTPEEAANAAKFSTPPPPDDPASLDGARKDPNYIGPTNFSAIQKQYTPYQIEQATKRDTNGNIFWNPDVNIADIPTFAPLAAPKTPQPMPAETGMGGASSSLTAPTTGSVDYMQRNEAAGKYLTGIDASIDNINATKEAALAKAKEAQQGKVDSLSDRLYGMLDSTKRTDARKEIEKNLQLDKQVADLGLAKQRVAAAQDALNQGLIFEEGRPTRMSLLTGRSSQLQKQGLAAIQSAQMVADSIRGDLDFAKSRADDAVADLDKDIADQRSALDTLFTLENDKLISLSDDEKDVIKERMDSLKAESERLKTDKDAIFDLATSFPDSFLKGNVTFLDSKEDAMKKMLPFLSESEKLDMEQKRLELEQTKANISKTKSGGAGSGSGSGGSGVISRMAEDVALLRAATNPDTNKPYTEQEIRTQLYSEYGDQFDKTTELNSTIDGVLQGINAGGDGRAITEANLVNFYGVPEEDLPEYIGLTDSEIKTKLQKNNIAIPNVDPNVANADKTAADAKAKSVKFYNPFSWF